MLQQAIRLQRLRAITSDRVDLVRDGGVTRLAVTRQDERSRLARCLAQPWVAGDGALAAYVLWAAWVNWQVSIEGDP